MTASPIDSYLAQLHERWQGVRSGQVADYIPPLAEADPDSFGIAIATTEGHCYEVGDARLPFTIQSISKPFTYGLALQDRGFDAVDAKVGVEPTGDAFNSISLAPDTGTPLNPMINAGAITSVSLVEGTSQERREQRILDAYGLLAGHELELNHDVYESERSTGHRNRAISHMLRGFGILERDPEIALDLYFRQCSVSVDCRDLALMAATLANGGVNPATGEDALDRGVVDRVLSVMTMCGMYDSAGEWVVDVGMPAKSGVAGGVLAVLPGQLGIAVYSPPLDSHGNSVRGIEVCRDVSEELDLHLLHVARTARSAIRRTHTLADAPSRLRRTDRQRAVLDEAGTRAIIQVLHGDLVFSAMESIVRGIVEEGDETEFAMIDLSEVTEMDRAAERLLAGLAVWLREREAELIVVLSSESPLISVLPETCKRFEYLDEASEWCEDRLLERAGVAREAPERISLLEHRLVGGMEAEQVSRLGVILTSRTFVEHEAIFSIDDQAEDAYLLVAGEVRLEVELGDGSQRRISTLAPGASFGELALVGVPKRPITVRGECAGECLVLSVAAYQRLGREDPALQAALMQNLLVSFYDVIGRLSRELGAHLGANS